MQDEVSWQAEQFGFSADVPQFVWDVTPAAPLDAARIVGAERVDGVDTQIVSFFTRSGAARVWFRLWIDGDGLVHRAEMRAQGHFMSHHYYDFDSPFTIEAPSS